MAALRFCDMVMLLMGPASSADSGKMDGKFNIFSFSMNYNGMESNQQLSFFLL